MVPLQRHRKIASDPLPEEAATTTTTAPTNFFESYLTSTSPEEDVVISFAPLASCSSAAAAAAAAASSSSSSTAADDFYGVFVRRRSCVPRGCFRMSTASSLSPKNLFTSFMAQYGGGGGGGGAVVPVVSDTRKRSASMQQRRLELEEEVAQLQKILEDEKKVHDILQHALLPHSTRFTLQIPDFVPQEAKKTLAELTVVEEEIARLESEIRITQEGLRNVRETQLQAAMKLNDFKHLNTSAMNLTRDRNFREMQGKIVQETKSMFFISQAMKGEYLHHQLSDERGSRNFVKVHDKKERSAVLEPKERIPRKSGVLPKTSSPKLPLKQPTNKPLESDAEKLLKIFQEPSSIASSREKEYQKIQPNKLSEKIMKCLICVFLRLIRTSRVAELEKSSNLARSTTSFLKSGSFRMDSSVNLTASLSIQKEKGQRDPYGIFEIEDSLLRDIGPYKNLVRFASNSFETKCISTSFPLLNKLRDMMNSLHQVDLRFLIHPQKLAFWINMYNICIMHGFLQHGFPANSEKRLELRTKAVLNIGGNKLNAAAIEHFILRQPLKLKEEFWKGDKENQEETVRNIYGLEHQEPNIAFALCSGSRSSPAMRIYTGDGVTRELEKSKLEYLQASLVVTSTGKLMIPSLIHSNMSEFASDLDSLMDWIINQLPASWSLRKSMVECLKSQTQIKINEVVGVIPFDNEFQYLLPM
uniref:DUF547 domain-containing protein n=1 Tax=Ananas comosus var. bracteatus TaxID=296719 RepID=A0A6V7NK99_ANACO|nr:unnamed protein product [Ananas comosus var. bracteatus]